MIPAIPPIGAGAVGGIGGIGPLAAPATTAARPAAGFGDALVRGIEQVSASEQRVDSLAADMATGGPTQITDLMVASTESQLSVDLLVQVRNRAIEAYQEVMRMPL